MKRKITLNVNRSGACKCLVEPFKDQCVLRLQTIRTKLLSGYQINTLKTRSQYKSTPGPRNHGLRTGVAFCI